tara:strand:- start:299 stop:736 length:438 start_codon:yes stop_codon:yes gene_type:complete
MKIGDKVQLIKLTEHYSRGVIGNIYEVVQIQKTDIKLCSAENNDYCFYTIPNNVSLHIQTESEVFATHLDAILTDIGELLKSKNKAYGNSALKPAKIFSQLNATESLCSRIDDKLMRIKNRGINDATEDTVDDLIGYLLLLKMSM